VALTVDPLAGSYYVEHLTNQLETGALELMGRVDALGGAAKAIAASFFQEEIARSAYEHQKRVEQGESVIVGVNRFSDGSPVPEVPTPDYSRLEGEQAARLKERKATRDPQAAAAALKALHGAGSKPGIAKGDGLVPLIVDAVRARASVGEIATTLRDSWGAYKPS
jgi:methylmalonyl-CoA mutase N-terminal domain/subunit